MATRSIFSWLKGTKQSRTTPRRRLAEVRVPPGGNPGIVAHLQADALALAGNSLLLSLTR